MTYYYDRDYRNQRIIAEAYISYTRDKKEFPTDLQSLVIAGYLAEMANYYKEPPGPFGYNTSFKESSYVVSAPDSTNADDLRVIGRRVSKAGEQGIDFNPDINLDVGNALRDKVRELSLQRKRL